MLRALTLKAYIDSDFTFFSLQEYFIGEPLYTVSEATRLFFLNLVIRYRVGRHQESGGPTRSDAKTDPCF